MTDTSHSFVIPAYGDSPHLEACLASLTAQSDRSGIVIATPTPSVRLRELSEAFDARLCVNESGRGIGADWNFALSCARTPWVTIAHQDDVYLPGFVVATMAAARATHDASLVFTGYEELVDTTTRRDTTLLRLKRILLELGFVGGNVARNRFFKTNALRFGCAIPCPSVTLNLSATGLRFREDLKIDLDWEAWLRLARSQGSFVYVRDVLMQHRVHAESETSAGIAGGARAAEDRAILRMMWPVLIADAIAATYGIAYRSNHA